MIVLGLPRLALEKLFIGSNLLNELTPGDSEKLWDTLQTTTNQPLLKINLYYGKAWWGNGKASSRAKVAFGPNFSDSPLGSVYPFYAIDEASLAALEYEEWLKTSGTTPSPDIQEKLDVIVQSKYDRPAALTIYCDYLNINFWETLQNQGELFDSPLQREHANHDPQTLFAASKAVVERSPRSALRRHQPCGRACPERDPVPIRPARSSATSRSLWREPLVAIGTVPPVRCRFAPASAARTSTRHRRLGRKARHAGCLDMPSAAGSPRARPAARTLARRKTARSALPGTDTRGSVRRAHAGTLRSDV